MAIYSLAHFNKGEDVATVEIRFSHLKAFMEKTKLVGALSDLDLFQLLQRYLKM